MKEHPILFCGDMVRAILEGRKTMTRRIVRHTEAMSANMMEGEESAWCPYGAPGDLLWVRETFRPAMDAELFCCIEYRADGSKHKPSPGALTEDQGHRFADDCPDVFGVNTTWKPSIFMPRWASRITLEVEAVRVEKVQDITEADAMAEGILTHGGDQSRAKTEFMVLWNKINAKRGYGWAVNPWVWVVQFRRTA